MERSFSVVDFPQGGNNYGRYIGKSPKRAAHKAFSALSRKINLNDEKDKNMLVFVIQDNGNNNKYKYVGTRVRLHNPIVRNINGKDISFRYKNIITKI